MLIYLAQSGIIIKNGHIIQTKPSTYRMYIETLSGQYTTLQKLADDIFVLKFSQSQTRSNHSSIIVPSKYCPSLKSLNYMIAERNRNYSVNFNSNKHIFGNVNSLNVNQNKFYQNKATERKIGVKSRLDSDQNVAYIWGIEMNKIRDRLGNGDLSVNTKYNYQQILKQANKIQQNQSSIPVPKQYDCQLSQQILSQLTQQLYQFNLNVSQEHQQPSPINIQQQRNPSISIIAKSLNQYITDQLYSQQSSTLAESPIDCINKVQPCKIQKFYNKLPMLPVHYQYFTELKRQIVDVGKCNKRDLCAILGKIMDGKCFNIRQQDKQIFMIKSIQIQTAVYSNENDTPNILKVYYLFLAQQPLNRTFLSRYLYQINNYEIFQIIKEYDAIIMKNSKNLQSQKQKKKQQEVKENGWVLQAMIKLEQKVNKIVNKYQQSQPAIKYLSSLLLTDNDFEWPNMPQFSSDLVLSLLGIKIQRWLTVMQLQNQSNRKQIQKRIVTALNKCQQAIFTCETFKKIKPYMIHLLLASYPQSFLNLTSNSNQPPVSSFQFPTKLLLLIFLCIQPQSTQNLLFLSNKTSILQTSNITLADFKSELYQQISKLKIIDQRIREFVCNCLPMLNQKQRVDLLVNNKQITQSIDWHLLSKQIANKTQLRELTQLTILRSIPRYHNTANFLNVGIQFQTLMPYFQIPLLLECLTQIGRQNAPLYQKDVSNIFGIISIFRDQVLPQQYRFPMAVLEMMIELYILRQALLDQDWKKVGISLRANLQPDKYTADQQQRQSMAKSYGLTQSTRLSTSTSRIHNHQCIQQFQTKQFLTNLHNQPKYHCLYIQYLHTILQSIINLYASSQKIIRHVKLQIWTNIWVELITANLQICTAVNININRDMDVKQKQKEKAVFRSQLSHLREKGIRTIQMYGNG